MSASSRLDGAITQTLEREDTPPPIPSSWRPLGSGEPMAARKIASHAARSAGRSLTSNTRPFDVPPRMNSAGRD